MGGRLGRMCRRRPVGERANPQEDCRTADTSKEILSPTRLSPPGSGWVKSSRRPSGARLGCGAEAPADGRPLSGYWTTMSLLPSGSRSQNSGGTGSPIRLTSGSTSTPLAFRSAW